MIEFGIRRPTDFVQPRNNIAVAINSYMEGAQEDDEMPEDVWEEICSQYKAIKKVIKETSQEILASWLIEWGYEVTTELYPDGEFFIVNESTQLFQDVWKLMLNKIK